MSDEPHAPVACYHSVEPARIIHDGSSRNRAVASRDGRAEPRGTEAYWNQYVEGLSGEPARMPAVQGAGRLVAAANERLQQKHS